MARLSTLTGAAEAMCSKLGAGLGRTRGKNNFSNDLPVEQGRSPRTRTIPGASQTGPGLRRRRRLVLAGLAFYGIF